MRWYWIVISGCLLLAFLQSPVKVDGAVRGGRNVRYTQTIKGGDTTLTAYVSAVFVFEKGRKGRALARKYARMLNAIKVTYPIALHAKRELLQMERVIKTLDEKEAKEYTKGVEERLKKQYTPVLKRISMYQGMILLKLIDRETGESSYELVKEFRGSFSAFFWQGIARLFGGNLKVEYDKESDDKIMEELLTLYRKGYI